MACPGHRMSGGIARRQPLARRMSDRARQSPGGLSARPVVGVHDGDDGVVEAALRAHQCVLEMEKPAAEPGAFETGHREAENHASQIDPDDASLILGRLLLLLVLMTPPTWHILGCRLEEASTTSDLRQLVLVGVRIEAISRVVRQTRGIGGGSPSVASAPAGARPARRMSEGPARPLPADGGPAARQGKPSPRLAGSPGR